MLYPVELQVHLNLQVGAKQTALNACLPYKSPNRISGSELLWRKLSDDHEWFVAAPNALLLQDGIVDVVEGQLR